MKSAMTRQGRRAPLLFLPLCLTLAGWPSQSATRAAVPALATQTAQAVPALEEARRLNDEGSKLFDAGRYAEAIAPAERALSLREKALGPAHPEVAESLNLLGKLRREMTELALAETLLTRALAMRERTPGPDHADTAETLNDLGELYTIKGDFARAEPLFMRSVLVYGKARGPEGPEAAKPLSNLGMLYVLRGDLARGEGLCVTALNVRMKALGPQHRRTAESFDTIGTLFSIRGDLVNSEQYLQLALNVFEKVLGPDHPDVAGTRSSLSIIYLAKNDLARAESFAQSALAIRAKAFGPDKSQYALSLLDVSRVHSAKGEGARAIEVARRAVSIMEKAFGPEHILVAGGIQMLATMLSQAAEAEPLMARVLAIREKAFGPDHMVVADSLSSLGDLYGSRGDFLQAELHHWRAYSIREKTFGPAHFLVASSLSSLADLLTVQGDVVRAEPLYARAHFIYEATFGPEHPLVAASHEKLGLMYKLKGDPAVSEQFLQRALGIREKLFGPDHPLVATSLNYLALTAFDKGEAARAEPLWQRALAILEKSPARGQAELASILNNLGVIYDNRGEAARAAELFRRAQSIADGSPAGLLPAVPQLSSNRAMLYMEQGDYAQAEPLFLKTLSSYEKVFGRDNPFVGQVLVNLGAFYAAKGDHARAVEFLSRGDGVRERNLSLLFASGSERQKLSYLSTISGETSQTVSFHTRTAPSDPRALRLALTTVLRRKGRTLDTMTNQVASLRRRAGELGLLGANDLGMLDQLSATQSQLSSLVLGGPRDLSPEFYQALLGSLYVRTEQLQDAISRRGGELRQQPVTIEQVQQSLPPRGALVEFFSYTSFDPKGKTQAARAGPPRYVAYVLRKEGEPLWADLGEGASIDPGITRLMIAVRCPQTGEAVSGCPAVTEVKRLARSLDERLMRPVRRLLGDARHVFISPDGPLNLLPFAALVDEHDRYLVENYSLTYLTSGRDLLRLQSVVKSKEPPLIMADPAFGKAGSPAASQLAPGLTPPASGAAAPSVQATPLPGLPGLVPPAVQSGPPARRSADLVAVNFGPLSGSANEARTLAALLPGARVLAQERATEAALKQTHGPSVLHIATHGFFLPDQPSAPLAGTFSLSLADNGTAQRVLVRSENPLLRSGLALAGANLLPTPNAEDGILTALEAAGLDLSGTKLVVLSACETGVGAASNGEGVYGLRRALVLAGSESQVMSLWQVSDDSTSDLMVGYYRRLLAGEGRTEALRQVQLEMIRTGARGGERQPPRPEQGAKADYSHPYYWAAFIQSGDWRGIDSKPGPPGVGR